MTNDQKSEIRKLKSQSGVTRTKRGVRPRITRISRMFLARSESESSAGLNVGQVSLYRRVPACRRGARVEISEVLNAPDWRIQSDQIAGNGSDALQVKNLGHSPADARRRGTLPLRAEFDQ